MNEFQQIFVRLLQITDPVPCKGQHWNHAQQGDDRFGFDLIIKNHELLLS
jgi:hypothetical protein